MEESLTSQLNNNQPLPEHLEADPKQQTATIAAKQPTVTIPVAAVMVMSTYIAALFAGKYVAAIVHDLAEHGYKYTVNCGRNGINFSASPTKFSSPVIA